MELAVSAVAGEVVSRLVSFLANKYYHWYTDETQQLETRLHQLLLRVRMVVEEADGRRITNSGMLSQLKTFADAMYRAYWALAAFRYSRSVDEEVQVSISSSSPLIKRSRSTAAHNHGGRASEKSKYLVDLQGAVESLEIAVANMAEFVVILGGCELRRRRPYDAHLYIDSFMFGRHAEKQELSNFLLLPHTHNHRLAAAPPPVLAIIGASGVGKKTLVAHVCDDERVRSRFSLILNLREADFSRITADHAGGLVSEKKKKKTLLVVEFVSEVDEADWTKFYSAVATTMGRGSKVVILSPHKKSQKFATVKPIFLNVLSFEEFSYLFETLAFGAANQLEHPRLLRVADEFARDMQSEWSLVTANLLADVLRRNLNLHFWISMLSRLRRVVDRNFSMYGEHPKLLLERGHEIVVTDFVVCCAWNSTDDVPMKKNLPKITIGERITFEELLIDPGVRPKVEFSLFTWESRLPPYTSFDHFVSSCVQDMPGENTLSPRKRRWAPF